MATANRSPNYDVVCLGSCCWDILGVCEEYPQLDQKRPLTQLAESGGGQAATAAAAVAKLGGRVAFIGRTGDDDYGRKIADAFRQAGVDISWGLQVVPGARSQFAFCVAEAGTGRRAIFWRPPSTGQLAPSDIDIARALDTKAVLVDGHHVAAATALARQALARNIPVVSDLERPREGLMELLALCDWPILPLDFALSLSDTDDVHRAGEKLRSLARGQVVITMGTDGSIAFTPDGVHHQPAFAVSPVVDTTGAGDVYHGAFALALAWEMTLPEAMRFASAAAALSCRGLGGRAALPSADEVRALIESA